MLLLGRLPATPSDHNSRARRSWFLKACRATANLEKLWVSSGGRHVRSGRRRTHVAPRSQASPLRSRTQPALHSLVCAPVLSRRPRVQFRHLGRRSVREVPAELPNPHHAACVPAGQDVALPGIELHRLHGGPVSASPHHHPWRRLVALRAAREFPARLCCVAPRRARGKHAPLGRRCRACRRRRRLQTRAHVSATNRRRSGQRRRLAPTPQAGGTGNTSASEQPGVAAAAPPVRTCSTEYILTSPSAPAVRNKLRWKGEQSLEATGPTCGCSLNLAAGGNMRAGGGLDANSVSSVIGPSPASVLWERTHLLTCRRRSYTDDGGARRTTASAASVQPVSGAAMAHALVCV